MIINKGELCFIKDEFFRKINDPFLKCNYETTKRPHYYIFQDQKTKLYWMVPCSSKVEKFEKIIREKRMRGKPVDGIEIVKIRQKKTVLLFQDMFPIRESYIEGVYIRQGQRVGISNPELIQRLDEKAEKAIKLLRHGVKFTKTQPDVNRIERFLIAEETRIKEEAIIKNNKVCGFEPTVSLVKNVLELQELSGKKCSLKDIAVLSKYKDVTQESVRTVLGRIAEECRNQEMSKNYERDQI